jgi:type III pantothenate kinase
MLLVVDVGNTHTAAGVYSGRDLLHEWRLSTERGATVDELAGRHDQILRLRGGSLADIEDVVVCSVVPSLTAAYADLSSKYIDTSALVLGPDITTGITIQIDTPDELGPDRLANAVAAWDRHGTACIVVDFGTATTFDAISGAGEYLGGAIAPGLETSLEALSNQAARLLKVDVRPPENVIGRSTVQSMQSGLVYGTVGQVDGIVGRLRAELGEPVAVIATGGLGSLITPLSETISAYDPQLTLQGLQRVHEMNAVSR